MTAVAAAKAELAALLQANSTGTPVATLVTAGVAKVTSFEPKAGDLPKPCAVTIVTAQITPTDYQFEVRIYSDASADAKVAQDRIDTVIDALDALLTDDFGPLNWAVTYIADLNTFVAVSTLEHGREDF